MHGVERSQREYLDMASVSDILSILKSQFAARHLYLKRQDHAEIVVQEFRDDDSILIKTPPGCVPDGSTMTIYGLSDKYVEVDLAVIGQQDENHFRCTITGARKATAGRRHLRFKLPAGEAVATNFKVSRQSIGITTFNVPTSIKVVMEQYHSAHVRSCDILKVDVFKPDDDPTLAAMKKTGKAIFIPDVSDAGQYCAAGVKYLDCADLYAGTLGTVIKKYVEHGYRSIIAVPILYVEEGSPVIPFGYIQMISKGDLFTIDRVHELQAHSAELVERIRDANTVILATRQEIADISRGGARLKISDPQLRELLVKAKGFIFDLVFKLQAPITIYSEIRSSVTDPEGNLYLGIDFEGSSSRKNEMKRFIAYLEPLETAYKARLAKSVSKPTG